MKCIISKRVKIPKEFISKDFIESELIVSGNENDIFCNREPMIMYKELRDSYIVPAIFGLKFIKENSLEYIDLRSNGDPIDVSFNSSLRENQVSVVKQSIDILKEDYGTILFAGCGMGKTVMSNKISCELKLKTLILVNTSVLLDQWIDRISEFIDGAKIGIIKQNKFDIEGKTHVVASAQTIVSRVETFDKNAFDSFGLLIVDECHNFSAQILSKVIGISGCKYRLGLSATPFRKDKFDKVGFHSIGEIGASIQRTTESQELNIECIQLDFNVEHHDIYRAGGKKLPNLAKMVNELCENDERNNFIIKAILQKVSEKRHIIVTSSRRNHLKVLADKLEENGFNDFGFLIGGIKKNPDIEKKQVLLCTFQFVAEGLDIPSLCTLIMISPKVDITQACGRILRTNPNKKTPVILDLVDCESHVFINQGMKRKAYYKKLGGNIKIVDKEFNIIKQAKRKSKVVEEKEEVDSRKRMCDIFKSKVH